MFPHFNWHQLACISCICMGNTHAYLSATERSSPGVFLRCRFRLNCPSWELQSQDEQAWLLQRTRVLSVCLLHSSSFCVFEVQAASFAPVILKYCRPKISLLSSSICRFLVAMRDVPCSHQGKDWAAVVQLNLWHGCYCLETNLRCIEILLLWELHISTFLLDWDVWMFHR